MQKVMQTNCAVFRTN
jgi:hypothetical protein